ncbi:MAG: transglycosylase SLT domain-containing protein [Rhodospirillales bacterium]|nr:transglycosylase SLT domain-containing protein [Rhodospirillales bacterium]
MREKTEQFQSTRFLIWTLVILNVLLIVMPANAGPTEEIRKIIGEEAPLTSVPASLAMAIVKTESNFRADHEGNDGARGLMQILPDRAESLGLDPRSLWQARPNIRAGLEILDGLLARTDGRWVEAVQAYGSQRRHPESVENKRFVTAVLKSERQYAEQFAAVDELSQRPVDGLAERRSEILSGHDDWGTPADRQTANRDLHEDAGRAGQTPVPFDASGGFYDPEQQAYADPGITIIRGSRSHPVEIVIYETEPHRDVLWQPAPPVFKRPKWRPAPPRRQFRPRRFERNVFSNDQQFAGNFGWHRAARRDRFERNGGRR